MLTRHSLELTMAYLQPPYLLSRAVWTLPGLGVVLGAVEGHVGGALAVLVVHLVALVDGDLVDLDGAAVLGGHQDLGRHDLAEEGEEGGAVPLRPLPPVLPALHEPLAQRPRARSPRPGHHVHAVRVGGRRLPGEAVV